MIPNLREQCVCNKKSYAKLKYAFYAKAVLQKKLYASPGKVACQNSPELTKVSLMSNLSLYSIQPNLLNFLQNYKEINHWCWQKLLEIARFS